MFFKTELEKNNNRLKKLLIKVRDKDSCESYGDVSANTPRFGIAFASPLLHSVCNGTKNEY